MLLQDADITDKILNAFYTVYNALGYGFLEKVYCNALAYEFEVRSLAFMRETPIDVFYTGRQAGHYRCDFIVERRIAVEVKASRFLDEADRKQTRNCLRATNYELALLLHFGPKPAFERFYAANNSKRALVRLDPT